MKYKGGGGYLLRCAVAAIISATPGMAQPKDLTPIVPQKRGIVEDTARFVNSYLDNSFNKYGSLDKYVYGDIGDKNRLGQIAFGVTHFPGHYVADSLRSLDTIFIQNPQEAMRRARVEKAEKNVEASKPKKYGRVVGVLKAPLDFVWGAGKYGAEVLTDSVRVAGHYAGMTIEGAINGTMEKATKEPLDCAAEVATTLWLQDWIRRETSKGGGSKGGGGDRPDLPDVMPPGEDPPPPPAFPKPF